MILEARNIHRSFGDIKVLKGVSLKVQKGEIVSIIGKSGAGKSTLLQILGTLDKANKGTVEYDGKDVLSEKDEALSAFRNKHIGFVFQFHHLLPEFTALENVCIPGYIAGRPKAEVNKKALELLDMLNLSHRIQSKPGTLSGGEQQRVAVARALINNPDVIMADEPSGNLDTQNAKELHELFLRLRNDLKQTFIIVTHNMELAHMADRTLRMVDGQFVEE